MRSFLRASFSWYLYLFSALLNASAFELHLGNQIIYLLIEQPNKFKKHIPAKGDCSHHTKLSGIKLTLTASQMSVQLLASLLIYVIGVSQLFP